MSATSMPPGLRVYWQPGCTSCLRAKEFLGAHGIGFESINVHERPEAAGELAALGVRTVPVIMRGADFVLGQDIDELARFVGVTEQRQRLSPDELADRLQALLAAAGDLLAALPKARLATRLPQRERTWLDLGFHVAMIVHGLLEAAHGGALTYEHYERRAPAAWVDAPPALAFLRATAAGFDAWWRAARGQPAALLTTYFGPQTTHALLERTAWHVAQHCRQLEYLAVEVARVPDAPRLAAGMLDGVPVPEAVWDREIHP
jgi:glutaredoxin